MITQKPNKGVDSSTLVAHYVALYREPQIELFAEKPHSLTKLRKEPSHPDIDRRKRPSIAIVKLIHKAPNTQTISLEVNTSITKLTERLRELSAHLKKPADAWLDPTAPILRSFLYISRKTEKP
jgi:hypothetical protein